MWKKRVATTVLACAMAFLTITAVPAQQKSLTELKQVDVARAVDGYLATDPEEAGGLKDLVHLNTEGLRYEPRDGQPGKLTWTVHSRRELSAPERQMVVSEATRLLQNALGNFAGGLLNQKDYQALMANTSVQVAGPKPPDEDQPPQEPIPPQMPELPQKPPSNAGPGTPLEPIVESSETAQLCTVCVPCEVPCGGCCGWVPRCWRRTCRRWCGGCCDWCGDTVYWALAVTEPSKADEQVAVEPNALWLTAEVIARAAVLPWSSGRRSVGRPFAEQQVAVGSIHPVSAQVSEPSVEGNRPQAMACYVRGYHAYWQGNCAGAVKEFDASIDAFASDARFWYYKGLCHIALGEADQAEKSLGMAVRLHLAGKPDDAAINQALERVQGRLRYNLMIARQKASTLMSPTGGLRDYPRVAASGG